MERPVDMLKAALRKLSAPLRSAFLRRVATVAAGTAAAQLIALLCVPVITRLYGPEAMGVQGIFVSTALILSTVAGLGYPMAVILPRSDREAAGLARVALLCALGTAFTIAVVLFFWGASALSLLQAGAIGPLSALLPFTVFALVASTTLSQWLIRQGADRRSASFSVSNAVIVNGGKILAALLHMPTAAALVGVHAFGNMASCAGSYLWWRRAAQPVAAVSPTWRELLPLMSRYKDFPLLRAPQNLVNSVAQNLPVLLVAGTFGTTWAGFVALCFSILAMPANLLATPVMSVLTPRLNQLFRTRTDPTRLLLQSTLAMSAAAVLPLACIAVAGPQLFAAVFGDAWREAGTVAQALLPHVFFQFINKPVVACIPAMRLQGMLLAYEFVATTARAGTLWLAMSSLPPAGAIAAFSLASALAYLWLIVFVITRARKAAVEYVER